MPTLNFTDTLETEICCSCGIRFAMPGDFKRRKRDDHKLFYCPSGHGQSYTGTTHEGQLKKEQALRAEAEAAQVRAYEAQVQAEEAAAKAQRSLTRLKRRVASGACPCCTRTFTNLARHMACKHPETVKAP